MRGTLGQSSEQETLKSIENRGGAIRTQGDMSLDLLKAGILQGSTRKSAKSYCETFLIIILLSNELVKMAAAVHSRADTFVVLIFIFVYPGRGLRWIEPGMSRRR